MSMTHVEVKTIQGTMLLPLASTKFHFETGRVFACVGSEWFPLTTTEQEIRSIVGADQMTILNKAMKKSPSRKRK